MFSDSDQGYASGSNEDLTPSARLGPPIRPLNLGGLGRDGLFAELESTVEGLQAWLEGVHTGLEDLMQGWEIEAPA